MASASSRQLASLLGRLEGGSRPSSVEITLLSGLTREDASLLSDAWVSIPASSRGDILVRAAELAEDNVDLDFDTLACIALRDEYPEVRARAADALWESTDRGVAELLRERLDDEDSEVRAAAASSLRQFVALREAGQFDLREGDAVVDALRARAEDPVESPEVRAAAIESLGVRSLPWVAELIISAYDSDDREIRLASIRAMGDSADERWIEYLHEQLYTDDPEFRFAAVVAAGELGSEDSVPPLADMLRDDDAEVVAAAIEALGEIGGDAAVEALEAAIDDIPAEFKELFELALDVARGGFGVLFEPGGDEGDD